MYAVPLVDALVLPTDVRPEGITELKVLPPRHVVAIPANRDVPRPVHGWIPSIRGLDGCYGQIGCGRNPKCNLSPG